MKNLHGHPCPDSLNTITILYAQLLGCLQRPDEALAQGQLAFELDPHNSMMKIWYGALLPESDCETVLTLAEELVAAIPGHAMAYSMIESAAYFCKDYNKAIEAGMNWIKLELNVVEDTIKKIERILEKTVHLTTSGRFWSTW